MKIDAETKTLLDNVFGEQLPADLVAEAKKLGFRSAISLVMADEGLEALRREAVCALIRIALCKGLGEPPAGWSLLPTAAAQHELAVWVLEAPVRAREVA
jgi:hypothetical protein